MTRAEKPGRVAVAVALAALAAACLAGAFAQEPVPDLPKEIGPAVPVPAAKPLPAGGSGAVRAMRELLEALRLELEALRRLRAAQMQLLEVNALRAARGLPLLRLPCGHCLSSPAAAHCAGLALSFDCAPEGRGAAREEKKRWRQR